MTLTVDFNMEEADGRLPALLPDGEHLAIGDRVRASDGEGLACLAEVVEVLKGRRYVMVRPIDGTWEDEAIAVEPGR